MRKVIQFFVNHSLLVNLISVFLFVAGLLSFFALQREAFPNVNYDVVTVQTVYFGAPPEEIEKLITIELEDELKEVNGIEEMTSVSTENISLIVIQIDPDETDKAKIVNDIQRAVDRVDDLPEDAEDPLVSEIQSKNMPILNVSLSGDFPEVELQRIARALEVELLDLPDVARIDRMGWRDKEIWVEVDPALVKNYHLALEDVILALKDQNLNIPGGTLTTKEGDYLVRTIGEFETAEEVKEVIVRANDLGNWISVKDVATVQDSFEDDDLIEKTYGQPAITLTVIKKEKGDIIDLVKQVKKTVSAYETKAPDGLRVSYFDDFSYYVKRRLNVLKNNGTVGMVFVVFALAIFLNRAVVAMTFVGIPIALLSAFFLMYSFGLTINLISMFGLIMVLGMVVDDAIIVAENIYRHLERGMPPKEAAIKGASEVAVPVITTVLTTIVAFVPLLFMSGVMGKFIWAIPVVVIIALVASLFESIFILPSHLADFASLSKKRVEKKVQPWFDKFQDKYSATLEWVIHHKYKAVGIFTGVFIFSMVLWVVAVPFILFPQGLIEEFIIKLKAPVGTSLEEMSTRMRPIEEIVEGLTDSELENYVTRIGIMQEGPDDPYSDRGTHVGQIHVYLTPEKTKARRNADEIIEQIRNESQEFSEQFEELTFDKVRAGPPVGEPISIRFRGDEFDELETVAEKMAGHLKGIEGIKDIKDDFDEGKPEMRILVNPQAANEASLSVRDIATTVRNAIEGGVATKIKKTDEEIEVIVRYPTDTATAKQIFDFVHIPNNFDNLVPLRKVARLEEKSGLQVIKHFDRKRMVNVTGDVNEKVITPIEVEGIAIKFFKQEIAPAHPDISISFGGEQEETKESMQDFMRALFLSVFLIFIILATFFNSIVLPIVVMMAIPLGITGVIFAFFLHGQPISFMSMVGLIGLSGVVVNDSIVLVDFIRTLRKQGLSKHDSLIEAGRMRLRPVILTTITTVAGLMPVAYGIGGRDPFLMPMALAIAWGLAFATVITLVIIPCAHSVADDVTRIVSRWIPWMKPDYQKGSSDSAIEGIGREMGADSAPEKHF